MPLALLHEPANQSFAFQLICVWFILFVRISLYSLVKLSSGYILCVFSSGLFVTVAALGMLFADGLSWTNIEYMTILCNSHCCHCLWIFRLFYPNSSFFFFFFLLLNMHIELGSYAMLATLPCFFPLDIFYCVCNRFGNKINERVAFGLLLPKCCAT